MKSNQPPPHLSHAPPWYRRFVMALRRKRVDLGLSLVEVDELIGSTTGQVGKWECYDRRPTVFFASCWAEALGMEIYVRKKR